MLSFKALSEKKTKVTLNPKLKDVMEKKGCSKCEDTCGKDCKCSCHDKEMSEAKKDDSYLETDFKKRQKNNEKARKEMEKIPGQKNPHFEAKSYDPMEDPDFDHDEAEATRGQSGKNKSITIKKKTKKTTKEETAYVSQEEVSEESNQESETETFLTFGQFCEDSRRMSNKQHTARVKQNIKAFGSNYTPPNNYDPDANRGQGEVLTRKQMEKKRRKSLRQEEVELDEATRAAKEGKKDEHRVGVAIRAKQSAETLAAKRARQKVLDAHEKKTGKKLDISKTPEGKKHAQHFGGSRQEKKVKGAKETPAETHNRRVGRQVSRVVKHGYTSKEKKEVESMAKHTSPRD